MRIHKSVVRGSGVHRTTVRVSPEDSRRPTGEQDGRAGIRTIAEDHERDLVAILQQKGVELQPFLNRDGRQIGLVAWTLDAVPWEPQKTARAGQEREPITQDASAALTQLKFLLMSMEDGNIMEAALDAYELGRLVERISVRQIEPHMASGRRALAAAKRGHKKISRSASQKAARQGRYQSWVADYRRRNPNVSLSVACERAAKHFRVSTRTVKRAVAKQRR
jgi:hypothetical protein